MTMKAPSAALLRAFFPPPTPCCQVRHSSNWMPRERFASITKLDKLHRRQRANNRKEKQDSAKRAQALLPPSFATPSQSTQLSEPSPLNESSSIAFSGDSTTQPTPTESPTADLTPSALPYFISRTKTHNLRIYEDHKAGGSKHITTLRKINGDLDTLQSHLLEVLNLQPSFVDPKGNKKANVVINRLTNQIIVRGWRGAEIKRWCELAGF